MTSSHETERLSRPIERYCRQSVKKLVSNKQSATRMLSTRYSRKCARKAWKLCRRQHSSNLNQSIEMQKRRGARKPNPELSLMKQRHQPLRPNRLTAGHGGRTSASSALVKAPRSRPDSVINFEDSLPAFSRPREEESHSYTKWGVAIPYFPVQA